MIFSENDETALLAQAEPVNERPVYIDFAAFEVIQQLAAPAHHAQQAAARVVILYVRFEMPGQFVDASRKQGYLNFGRPRISLHTLEIFDNLCPLAYFLINCC